MSTDLTVTLVYDDVPPIQKPGARHTLQVANECLKLIRTCERELSGKAPKLVWKVNIYSLADRAVIEFSTHADRGFANDVAERVLALIDHVTGAGVTRKVEQP